MSLASPTFTLTRRVRTPRVRHGQVFGQGHRETGSFLTGELVRNMPVASAGGMGPKREPSLRRTARGFVARRMSAEETSVSKGRVLTASVGRNRVWQDGEGLGLRHPHNQPDGVGQLTKFGQEWRFVTSCKPREGKGFGRASSGFARVYRSQVSGVRSEHPDFVSPCETDAERQPHREGSTVRSRIRERSLSISVPHFEGDSRGAQRRCRGILRRTSSQPGTPSLEDSLVPPEGRKALAALISRTKRPSLSLPFSPQGIEREGSGERARRNGGAQERKPRKLLARRENQEAFQLAQGSRAGPSCVQRRRGNLDVAAKGKPEAGPAKVGQARKRVLLEETPSGGRGESLPDGLGRTEHKEREWAPAHDRAPLAEQRNQRLKDREVRLRTPRGLRLPWGFSRIPRSFTRL
jgi:hypothetical protein